MEGLENMANWKSYSELSAEQRKRIDERTAQYNREKAKRITLKMGIPFYDTLMVEIEKSGKSMNKFILDVLREKIGYNDQGDQAEDAEPGTTGINID